jgi:hypothetical protein
MINSGIGALVSAGLVTGLLGSMAMMYYTGTRVVNTSECEEDWRSMVLGSSCRAAGKHPCGQVCKPSLLTSPLPPLPPCPHIPADEDVQPDWPGPKAWPAGMCLISFFIFSAYVQGLKAGL